MDEKTKERQTAGPINLSKYTASNYSSSDFSRPTLSQRVGRSLKEKNQFRLSISPPVFDFIYKNKIVMHLDDPEKFFFQDMNVLLAAYEYWRFERKNQKIFAQLDHDWTMAAHFDESRTSSHSKRKRGQSSYDPRDESSSTARTLN